MLHQVISACVNRLEMCTTMIHVLKVTKDLYYPTIYIKKAKIPPQNSIVTVVPIVFVSARITSLKSQ